MGTVLAMTGMAKGLGAGGAALLLLLAGCAGGDAASGGATAGPGAGDLSAGDDSLLSSTVTQLGNFYAGNAVTTERPEAALFSAEAIAADPDAFRIMQVNALGLVEPGRRVEAHGAEATFQLQSGPTAAFDEGILVATRGFPDDLMTLDSRGVLAALRAGGGEVRRAMEVLDTQDQITTTVFDCTIAAAGAEEVDLGLRRATLSRLDETCRSPALVFQNIYWLDDAGTVAASRQYVSPTVAYLRANRL